MAIRLLPVVLVLVAALIIVGALNPVVQWRMERLRDLVEGEQPKSSHSPRTRTKTGG